MSRTAETAGARALRKCPSRELIHRHRELTPGWATRSLAERHQPGFSEPHQLCELCFTSALEMETLRLNKWIHSRSEAESRFKWGLAGYQSLCFSFTTFNASVTAKTRIITHKQVTKSNSSAHPQKSRAPRFTLGSYPSHPSHNCGRQISNCQPLQGVDRGPFLRPPKQPAATPLREIWAQCTLAPEA